MKLSHLVSAAAVAFAAFAHAQATTAPPAAPGAAAAAPVDGEVRKIDREQGKLTLRHAPLPHLEMPAMTMVFRVADPKLLDSLKEGDKVKFTADKVNGAFTVTSIGPAR